MIAGCPLKQKVKAEATAAIWPSMPATINNNPFSMYIIIKPLSGAGAVREKVY